MKRSWIAWARRAGVSGFTVATVLGASLAVAADVAGSKDLPWLSRFPQSKIIGYGHRDWDQTLFPLSAEYDANQGMKSATTVEGEVTRVVYLSPVGKAPLEVFRNYQQALVGAGLVTKFSCSNNCGHLPMRWRFAVRDKIKWGDNVHSADHPTASWAAGDALDDRDAYALYGTLARNGHEVHVTVYTSIAAAPETRAAVTIVEAAEPKAMQSGQVTVDADALFKGLTSEGRITLSGLYFETGKAVIQPQSDLQLEAMAKLLREHAKIDVFIVGHTDNAGTFDSNLSLSRDRAQAVKQALTSKYQIAPARLTPYGVANVAPAASNADEAGRARNRRVELVLR